MDANCQNCDQHSPVALWPIRDEGERGNITSGISGAGMCY